MKKPYILIVLALFIFTTHSAVAQVHAHKQLYHTAFEEQQQMLTGEIPVSLKRAVFLNENAYLKGSLSYADYCYGIDTIVTILRQMIQDEKIGQFRSAGNWATFHYMKEPSKYNNFTIYDYDFADIAGAEDPTSLFVTKLMQTKLGQCVSLPVFYKILCDELGSISYLAIAPNHMYIKHPNDAGAWYNVELTNGGFPRDEWIVQSLAVPLKGIQNKVYMNPLSDQEMIAFSLCQLATSYVRQYGHDDFVIKVIDEGLHYTPNLIHLLMEKANYYLVTGMAESRKQNPDIRIVKGHAKIYWETVKQFHDLGYEDTPEDHYQQMLQVIEDEKEKRKLKEQEAYKNKN